MPKKIIVLAVIVALLNLATGWAQTGGKLALTFRDIYGPNGLKVDSETLLPDGSNHTAHFTLPELGCYDTEDRDN